MHLRTSRLLLVALVASTAAQAEKAAFNVHVEPSIGTGLDQRIMLTGASLKLDTTLFKQLGPVAPQVEFFGVGSANRTYLNEGSAFGVGVGARVYLFNDEKGFLFNPGKPYGGNLWGAGWVDAHLNFCPGPLGIGFDVGAGYEFSLLTSLSVGPYVKFVDYGRMQTFQFGLSFTIGAPETAPADSDYDNDGILAKDDKCPTEPEDMNGVEDEDGCPEGKDDKDKDGIPDATDKCPTEPEDKDGFQDEDGCPDTDNDADGLLDGDDKCPLVAGPKENKGCPDGDRDGDSIVDRADKCPDQAGPRENEGCPDIDTDGDTVADRLDKCPTEKGEVDNHGCPYPDTDGDGVVDRFDNCPQDKGPVTNQGCPEKMKQLVVITREKIVIKDKVYFATGKAVIKKQSFNMLTQIASVLTGHPELEHIQIEGHTDNTGGAELNRTLSQARAESVRAFLIGKGVKDTRLKARGFGPDQPADTNDTPEGRENNRRVEFKLVAG